MSTAKAQEANASVAWKSNDGQSRLYHGDSLQLMAALPADSVDCIWTDPPYHLSNDGITCVAGRMVKVNKGELSEQRGVIDNYYLALGHIYPDSLQNKLTFFGTLGFGAMLKALPTVFDLALQHHKGFRVEDVTQLLKRVEDFDFASWQNYGTGTGAENQAGEDFRQELLSRINPKKRDGGSLRLR